MKVVSKHIDRDKSGYIRLIAEEAEDLWHVYNLLCKGDQLKASTVRRVVTESETGSTQKTSHRLTLTIRVDSIFFDTQVSALRVNGQNREENKYVKMGAFHTLDLELNRPFTIIKQEWDRIYLDRISMSCDITQRADIAAVMLQEGLAQICLITENMTVVRSRIEMNVPKKRRGTTTDHDKGLVRFFNQIYTGICQHVNFEVVKVLIIASPGFLKEALLKYIVDQALLAQFRPIIDNRSKIILVHASSAHKHILGELLQAPSLQTLLSQTKYAKEITALSNFYKLLAKDEAKAFYGYDYVIKASHQGTINQLLIVDSLFRSSDIPLRKQYIALVETVRKNGGEVLIFSALHTSGEQLEMLTGVAASMLFSLYDLEAEVDDELEKRRIKELVK